MQSTLCFCARANANDNGTSFPEKRYLPSKVFVSTRDQSLIFTPRKCTSVTSYKCNKAASFTGYGLNTNG
ncbi:hypothetical protein AXX17_AT1G34180 [Arabidopsis thaliana]|uniref:Uncharacterized protein n=1 Tax=Arabidopsis thaliana TaxID=3702 RepID=A0A178WAP0_ARATH|nr:hypothetical protein AXX17_AT1G34180 [Arabidopsis thaliana]